MYPNVSTPLLKGMQKQHLPSVGQSQYIFETKHKSLKRRNNTKFLKGNDEFLKGTRALLPVVVLTGHSSYLSAYLSNGLVCLQSDRR